MGFYHLQSLKRAYKLIGIAKEIEVDVVKF